MARTRKTYLVTRDTIRSLLSNPDRRIVEATIGRALVVLLNKQTESEAAVNETQLHNMVGFTGADAKSGSITAKTWLKRGCLEDWQIERWTRVGKSGYPRLAKYWKQLDNAAKMKAARKARQEQPK